MEFEIQFTDVTMCEGGGIYSEIKDIMKNQLLKEGIKSADWTIRSSVIIKHETGMCKMTCEFKFGPIVRICDYQSTSKDIFNDDARCLRFWCESSGWGVPDISQDASLDALEYWKTQWETFTVNSSYLEKRFGKRPEIDDTIEEPQEDEQ